MAMATIRQAWRLGQYDGSPFICHMCRSLCSSSSLRRPGEDRSSGAGQPLDSYSLQSVKPWNLDRHTIDLISVDDLQRIYKQQKVFVYDNAHIYHPVDIHAVFTNNELSFKHIDVYGFDYDYTLANYSDELHVLIYHLAMETMIVKYGYPQDMRCMTFNPDFPIRGLHFDTVKGFLMKIDQFNHVQLGTVYRGMEQVDQEEVLQTYHGTHIDVEFISKGGHKRNGTSIHQQMDLFSIPFVSLLSNMIQYLKDRNLTFDPEYIYNDVEGATREVHLSGLLHEAIIKDIERYLPKDNLLVEYLERLSSIGKKIFMITNSGFRFVDKGMSHLLGSDWLDLFDVVITNARKPKFFSGDEKPFRTINRLTGFRQWDQVQSFQKHGVYCEGNVHKFMKFTSYDGPNVLYFGDHVYSDLMDPVLRHGWRTGAIIPELEREIYTCNSKEYVNDVQWLLCLEELISALQLRTKDDAEVLLAGWKKERKHKRKVLKDVFNPYFGSMFRTYHNPTSFSKRLTRYADLYTSSLDNLLHYTSDYTFFPRRNALPHEMMYYKRIYQGYDYPQR